VPFADSYFLKFFVSAAFHDFAIMAFAHKSYMSGLTHIVSSADLIFWVADSLNLFTCTASKKKIVL
jgi:hypothetical protein